MTNKKDNKTDKNNTKQSSTETRNINNLNRIKQKAVFIKSLKAGTTHKEASEAAGVAYITVWTWKQQDKEFAKACEAALESRIKIVEDALYQSATGKEGKAKIIAQIFWLKNRGKNWKDKQDIEFTAPKEVKQNTFVQAGKEPVIKEESDPGTTQATTEHDTEDTQKSKSM